MVLDGRLSWYDNKLDNLESKTLDILILIRSQTAFWSLGRSMNDPAVVRVGAQFGGSI